MDFQSCRLPSIVQDHGLPLRDFQARAIGHLHDHCAPHTRPVIADDRLRNQTASRLVPRKYRLTRFDCLDGAIRSVCHCDETALRYASPTVSVSVSVSISISVPCVVMDVVVRDVVVRDVVVRDVVVRDVVMRDVVMRRVVMRRVVVRLVALARAAVWHTRAVRGRDTRTR